jgi:hypothetical protein
MARGPAAEAPLRFEDAAAGRGGNGTVLDDGW